MEELLTVAAVARQIGVAPATLRTWARRYGLGPSGHEAGEHRRYCASDLAKLMLMRRLISAGVAPADAAEQDFINRSQGGVPDVIDEVEVSGAPLGIAALLKNAGLAPSSSEANRLIEGNGVRVDSNVVTDKGLKLPAGTYVLQVGKRKFARVTLR